MTTTMADVAYWFERLLDEGYSLDTPVILASDPEGNYFRELSGYGIARWSADEGEIYSEDDDYEDPLQEVLVLWP